jgi:hypothetical protein
MPAVLLLLFGGIQFGLHDYARSIALAAAQAGARAATAAPASPARGQQAAREFLAANASGVLSDTTVTATQTGNLITVTVTGRADQLVPLTGAEIRQHASGPAETLP